MGKQMQICTTDIDNEEIRNFLVENYDCSFFQVFSKEEKELFINDFKNTYYPYSSINIWNKHFDWMPTYKQTATEEKLYYIENYSNAPIIQLEKTNWNTQDFGRIYWSKTFFGFPDYNLTEFELFYNEIIKWVKKNTKGKMKYGSVNVYFLEDAWKKQNETKTFTRLTDS